MVRVWQFILRLQMCLFQLYLDGNLFKYELIQNLRCSNVLKCLMFGVIWEDCLSLKEWIAPSLRCTKCCYWEVLEEPFKADASCLVYLLYHLSLGASYSWEMLLTLNKHSKTGVLEDPSLPHFLSVYPGKWACLKRFISKNG